MHPPREIRAFYTQNLIRVYQAFNNNIGDSLVQNKKIVSPPFSVNRTTWIKPSFLWMMYRSGWASKQNQERIFAIDIKLSSFWFALENACLSSFNNNMDININLKDVSKNSPIIIQWDPERNIFLEKLSYRTIQIGIKPPIVNQYISDWVTNIIDITQYVKNLKSHIDTGRIVEALYLLPQERKLEVPLHIQNKIIF